MHNLILISAKTQNRNEVKVVDPVTNTYSYSGFNFVKHEDHCVCSTCGATLKLRALNDHHVNIRNHINAVHIGKLNNYYNGVKRLIFHTS